MKDAKHTPGPWALYDGHKGYEIHSKSLIVACITTEPNAVSEDANAYLIAAAPDLLALADLVMEIDVDGAGLWDAQQAARAAIAKAKGETT